MWNYWCTCGFYYTKYHYGLEATSSSSIHLKSLTEELISTNNGGGGNYGGDGTIKTI